ncbi:CBS domain-containing protein [Leptolyngbya sp. CCNP1308]|uniref:CBS domain-containing protein n=1 Tax=Leptolyngbya sp. CCNP1308 TaxID=3110255 RepID=UPI002B1F40A2|nr:CBS domain-containing protein [Leptolyngbya sp. CCNP1308]MEA5448716.1 CBS domain-containing protein [Leptolyngbya sp. CCNP1308]
MPNLQTANFGQSHRPEALWSLGTTPVTVPQTATLQEVINSLGEDSLQGHSCVLVVQGQQLVGLVTDRDVIRMVINGVDLATPVHQLMTDSLTVLPVGETHSALDILDLMRQRQIHHVPLVNADQHPVRLVTIGSLQQTLQPPHVLKLQRAQSRMTTNLATAHPTDSALAVATLLAEYQVNCVAVVDPAAGVLLGLVLRQDVLRFQARQLDLAQLPVQAIMRDPQLCLQPNDSLWLAYKEMSQHRLPCLVVGTPEQQPLGVISQSDLLYSLDLRELQASFSHLWQTFKQSDSEQVEIWKSHSSELERLVQGRTELLEEQAKCDRLLTTLTQRIHESLEVQDVLSTTVGEVRQLLGADRALIYRFDTAASGTVAVEAVVPPWQSLLGHTIEDTCFEQHWAEAYRYGRFQAVEDIQRAGLSPCHVEMLEALQIRANLVVPIVCNHQLWGLLVINQCGEARRWRDWETRLVEQLARSVAIAVRQSELYQKLQEDLETRKQYEIHLQQLNDQLEQRVEERTASWRQVTEKLSQEVDQRRQAEQTLAKTNQQLQAVLNAVPAMVSWVGKDGRYLGCNHRLADSFDLLPADFIGQHVGFLGQASPFCQFAQDFLGSEANLITQEMQFSANGVASHWLLVAQKYDQGSAAVFVGLDISDREQAKAALQTSEIKFRSLVEQTNDWVWEIDRQFAFSYINPRATEILDCPAEAILSHRFTDFMADDEAVRFSTILALLVGQRQPFTQLEATCLRPSGEAVTLDISGSPIFTTEGEFEGYRGITRDITERKQVEVNIRKALTREKELGDLKTRFISMASHEFRTPLTTILASAETLERYGQKFPPEKQQVVLKRIQTSVHHMIGLLNDVLTVGKAEAGKLDCTVAPIDLQQFCLDLVEEVQFAQISTASPIEFIATGDRFWVLADEKLLRHMLLNLLSNAVKYSPEHTPVTFTLNCGADQTVLQVSDRGIGIPPADQTRLFGAFHRADNVGNISGTGLGLVIAKRAAEAHQGQISFVSEAGIGTTFTVVLPLVLWSDHHG